MDRLAVYLDELSDDPNVACKMAADAGLSHVCLRRVWGSNVKDLSDEACQKLKDILNTHHLKVALFASDLGRVMTVSVARDITLANYFKALYARVLMPPATLSAGYDQWLKSVADEFRRSGVELLLEVTTESVPLDVEGVLALAKGARAKLLYDPAQFMMRQRVNPFEFWDSLSGVTGAVDLHDYKIGRGHRPLGTGDAGLKELYSSFRGWRFIEIGLGKPSGDVVSSVNNLKAALDFIRGLNDVN